ncbi:hypothetical protein L6164_006988 [Bauhinia variegata]|uniref:Uncharacterized protein n=1 Tax=Bauhinia variegata TaxID=167791 RepID=A0ACB9PVJ4_BAUVA|nr:hypothetical protein L6164_006988 [Bauhinia variegata]
MEPFWVKNTASSSIVVVGWHRLSYEFSDGSLNLEELKTQIRKVHAKVGNTKIDGTYIIFGAGAIQLLHAAVHALSAHDSVSTAKFITSTPYYPGDTSKWKKDAEDSSFIELVTSPNNPDGELRKAVLQGSNAKTIHDLAYYWPHFTPVPSPADEDLMIFTLSKLTGHAGSRFG